MPRTFIFLVILFLGVITFPFFTIIAPREAAEFFYTELSYAMIVDSVVKGTYSDEETALKIFDYVRERMFALPDTIPKREKHAYDNLVSSIGWCDQQDNVFVVLAGERDIPTRLVFLRGSTSWSQHSVAEVLIGNKYRVFDVLYGYIFRLENGEIATFDDIQQRGPSLPCKQLELTATKSEQETYFTRYAPDFPPTITKDNSREWKRHKLMEFLGGNSKKNKIFADSALIVGDMLRFYHKIFGKPFYNLYQELYLAKTNFSEKDYNLFFKARALHLASRYEKARKYYYLLLEKFPRSNYVSDTHFFIATSFMEEGKYGKALESFSEILRQYTRWEYVIHYYMGVCFLKEHNYDEAKRYLQKVKKYDQTNAAFLLEELQ